MIQPNTTVSVPRGPVILNDWTLDAELKAKFGTDRKFQASSAATRAEVNIYTH